MKDKLTKSERSALAKTLNQTRNILKNEPTVKDINGRVIVRAGIVRKQHGAELSLRGPTKDDVFLAKKALDKHHYPPVR